MWLERPLATSILSGGIARHSAKGFTTRSDSRAQYSLVSGITAATVSAITFKLALDQLLWKLAVYQPMLKATP